MRAVLQRVSSASVTVDGKVTGSIGPGLCVLLGVSRTDGDSEAEWLADKIVHLRIFEDNEGKHLTGPSSIRGLLLAVSQFTSTAIAQRDCCPSFVAADPGEANRLYEVFKKAVADRGVPVESGVFQAHMMVEINNDGPVTLLLEREGTAPETEGCGMNEV
ncbi:D-aminoacyl-tRNA deacylase [Aminivibrio sp.]